MLSHIVIRYIFEQLFGNMASPPTCLLRTLWSLCILYCLYLACFGKTKRWRGRKLFVSNKQLSQNLLLSRKKRLCNYWRKNSLNRRSFFSERGKTKWNVKSFQKNERVEGRTENESFYFSLSPQDFSSFYLTSDTSIDWLSLDKEREKKIY